ncbi:MAG: DUF72 domain-containing protein [Pseudomonadota bacterium]|nr:DUF72 domain-containing protein [Pseudomonadota bacterium]
MAKSKIHIGTSGWSYDHWKGPFYPEELPNSQMLGYYSQHLQTVEINNSFYHLPRKSTLKRWRDTVPENFVFTAKASRYITHMKKLKNPEKSLSSFLNHISTLEDKLGPILFQLPPHWHFNAERLENFLRYLSNEFSYAFEFRDKSWLNEHTCELLSRYDVAFCIYELDGFLSAKKITTNFVYVRLHGPGAPYQGSYDSRTLTDWAEAFSSWSAQGHAIYCYFDNDQSGYAAQNAEFLQSMLQGQSGQG